MWLYQKYGRIVLSIIGSLFIVLFIVPIFATPGRLTNLISKIKIPDFKKILTLNFNQTTRSGNPSALLGTGPTPPTSTEKQTNSVNFIQVSSTPTRPIQPTPTGSIRFYPSPTIYNRLKPFITITSSQSRTYIKPTIKPTKIPRPTKAPDVFPIDPSLARPGKTSDEVFKIASEKTCVPVAVLKSIAYIESGEFFSVVSPKYFLLYNSYNWWNSPYLTEEKRACGGYDFDDGSGLVEADSKFAGYNCHSDGSTAAQSYMLGPMQIAGYWQTKFGKEAAKLLGVSKIDRRVILDAITIAGILTKTNVKPTSCTNWSGHDVAKAACAYYGSCNNGYCTTFCNNYRKFGGKGGCDAGAFTTGCW